MPNESNVVERLKGKWRKQLFNIVLSVVVVVGGAWMIFSGNWHKMVLSLRHLLTHTETPEIEPTVRNPIKIRLVDGKPDTIQFITDDPAVPPTVIAKVPTAGEPLQLMGTLYIEPDAFVRVHSRFAGEVVRIGMVDERGNEVVVPESNLENGESQDKPADTAFRADDKGTRTARKPVIDGIDPLAEEKKANVHGLRMGDRVHKGQLLAVVWSKEIGEKKSELVDAVSRLRLSKHVLDRLLKLKPDVVSRNVVNEAQRDFERDMVAVQGAERTLRSWRLSEEEIAAMHREAERLHAQQKDLGQILEDLPPEVRDLKLKIDPKVERKWAQVEVRSPLDGMVLERSFSVGQIVDTNDDMFKIGDPRRLRVLAYVYEEDLPYIRSLPAERRIWRIDLKSDPNDKPITSHFDVIGKLIDPQMHTGAIMGPLNDPAGHFAGGQFVTCTIDRAPDPSVVVVPSSAVIENGETSSVFVQTTEGDRQFTRRRIHAVRRGRKQTQISSISTGLAPGVEPLNAGEVVISSGVLELSVELDNQKSSAQSSEPENVAGKR